MHLQAWSHSELARQGSVGSAAEAHSLLCGSPLHVTSQICICPIFLLAELAWVRRSVGNGLRAPRTLGYLNLVLIL